MYSGECDHAKGINIGVSILTGCKVAGMVGVDGKVAPIIIIGIVSKSHSITRLIILSGEPGTAVDG